jgi:1-phosphatidylinositol-3-phosphate 5-kinase
MGQFSAYRSEDDDDESTDQAKEGFYGPGRAFDSQSQEEEECDSCLETDLMEVSLIHNIKYLNQVAEINGHNRSENAISMTDNSSDLDRSLSRRSMLSCDDYEESVDESNLYTHSLVSGPTAAVREELIDLEENTSVWVPPPPEDYEDEMALTMVYDDDDEEEGRGWGRFSNSEYRIHEKANALQEQRRAMRAAVDGHFRTLVGQLLGGEGLDIDENDTDNWLRIVADLALQAASYIKPDTSKGGGMDPGGYVKVKCIATGKRSDR